MGYLLVPIVLAIQAVIFLIGYKYFGVWDELTWLIQSSTSVFPAITVFVDTGMRMRARGTRSAERVAREGPSGERSVGDERALGRFPVGSHNDLFSHLLEILCVSYTVKTGFEISEFASPSFGLFERTSNPPNGLLNPRKH